MATIRSLAPETLSYILELAHSPRHRERASTCSYALVCRAWRDCAQRVLFQHLQIQVCCRTDRDRPESNGVLEEWEQEAARWNYLESVRLYTPRRVELVRRDALDSRIDHGSPELRWCQGATELYLEDILGDAQLLEDVNLIDVERLEVCSCSDLDFRNRFQRIDLPNLKVLHIVHDDDFLREFWDRCGPDSCLEQVDITTGLGLANTPTSFGKISGEDYSGWKATLKWSFTLDLTHERKRSLVRDDALRTLLTQMAGLTHFTHVIDTPNMDPHISLLEVMASLPPSITRLSFRRARRIRLDPAEVAPMPFEHIAVCVIEQNKLPSLSRLDFADCKMDDVASDADAATLIAACEQRLIRLFWWEHSI